MVLIYGLIFLLVFLSIAVGLFIYSKKKKSKVGLTISIVMIAMAILALLTNTIDEFTISKKDVVSDLKHIDIELKDDFEITNNKMTGMPERTQETEIKISQKDKDRLISEIKNSANFKSFTNRQEIINDTDTEQFGTSEKVYNFKYPEFYSRETYTNIDNFPTRILVTIYDETNTLKYQRIED